MKSVDLTELIARTLEHVVLEQWKHDGHIDSIGSDKVDAVIGGKKYRITITEEQA